jgi:lactoylglutathione lyase
MKRGSIAVGHVGLNVSDIDVSKVFYEEVLGFALAHEYIQGRFRYACFARDGRIALTLWEHSGGHFKKHRPGLHHLAFEASSIEEVSRTKGLLENLGMRWSEGALGCSEGTSLDVIYFEDPDGIRIEVYCPAGAGMSCDTAANAAA